MQGGVAGKRRDGRFSDRPLDIYTIGDGDGGCGVSWYRKHVHGYRER